MGYYHSWRGPDAREAFRLIRADFEKLILPLADIGCPIGPLGTGLPEITDDYIQFNGIRHCWHEKVEGPVVLFPTKFAYGINCGSSSRLIDTPLMTFTMTRRCDGQSCHDDFWLGKHCNRGFCKTAFKPYDVAVTAALLIAKHHWGERFEVRSCGSDAQWWDAKLICQRVIGYGALFKFVAKRHLCSINGQSQEIEEELFEEVPGSEPADPDRPPDYEEGWREGMLDMLRKQIEYRFGPLTRSNEQRLSDLSCGQIKDLARRLLQARTLNELWL